MMIARFFILSIKKKHILLKSMILGCQGLPVSHLIWKLNCLTWRNNISIKVGRIECWQKLRISVESVFDVRSRVAVAVVFVGVLAVLVLAVVFVGGACARGAEAPPVESWAPAWAHICPCCPQTTVRPEWEQTFTFCEENMFPVELPHLKAFF